jgi:hypothetical protein
MRRQHQHEGANEHTEAHREQEEAPHVLVSAAEHHKQQYADIKLYVCTSFRSVHD